MNILQSVNRNLDELCVLCDQLSMPQYNKELELFEGSTLGMHLRHIIEFYIAVVTSADNGEVCYDDRKRNHLIQTDSAFAKRVLSDLKNKIQQLDINQPILLKQSYNTDVLGEQQSAQSSIGRELMYAIDHSVHHQAIIRMGLNTMGHSASISNSFGVAAATQRSRS